VEPVIRPEIGGGVAVYVFRGVKEDSVEIVINLECLINGWIYGYGFPLGGTG